MVNKYKYFITISSFALILLLAAYGVIYAKKNGVNGRTSQTSEGCNCHNSNSSLETTLSATSSTGSFTVKPGSKTTFTVTVNNATLAGAGIGIAVKSNESGETNSGTLETISGEGLQKSGAELVHSSVKSLSNGKTSFSFNWTAPTTPGNYYLRAIANAVNNNNSTSGDKWNWLTPQVITVENGNSVDEIDLTNSVFPNPFKEQVSINLNKYSQLGIQELAIFDASGNQIRRFNSSDYVLLWDGKNSSGINVPAGIYYLQIKFRDGLRVVPIISL